MRSDGFLRTFGLALCLALTPQIHARTALDHEAHYFQHAKALNITSKSNVTTAHYSSHPAVALQAPKYPNVTVGQAWVYPSSPFDLGARAMSCECFAPTDICCMSNTVHQPSSQFCMPGNSTCCGNTFCPPKSTCCGDFCCDLGNTCITSPTAGCCPIGKTCLSTVKCYDHSSQQCTGEIKSPYCCSEEAPFCRTEESHGLACYASSKASSTTTPSSPTAATVIPHFLLQPTTTTAPTPSEPANNNNNNNIPTPSPASLIFANLDNNNNNIPFSSPTPPTFPPFSDPASPAPSSPTQSSKPTPENPASAPSTSPAANKKPYLCYDNTIGSAKPCPTVPAGASNATMAPPSSAAGIQLRPVVWAKNGKVLDPTTLALTLVVLVMALGSVVGAGFGVEVERVEEGEGGCQPHNIHHLKNPLSSNASRLGRGDSTCAGQCEGVEGGGCGYMRGSGV